MVGIKGKSFTVAELAAAGVKRISLATSLYRAAMTGLMNAAKEVREHGTFGYLDTSLATPRCTRSCASRPRRRQTRSGPVPERTSRTTMAKTRGTGLLMVWTDIDAEHEAEFNRWYDEEHITRLLAVPGFLCAARYVALKGGRNISRSTSSRTTTCCAARPISTR